MTVTYTRVRTGRTPHEIEERLLTTSCPSCGADWTVPGNGLPRGSQRCYLCTVCGVFHPAMLVHARDERERGERPANT